MYHILTGKRTTSVLLSAVRSDLERYFGLFPKLKQDWFINKVEKFSKLGLIEETAEEFMLTEEGHKLTEDYFMSHQRVMQSNQLRYAMVVSLFKKRVLFLSQVLSEAKHQNTHYFPIEKRVAEQTWLKHFLKSLDEPKEVVAEKLGYEWIHLLEKTSIKNKALFVQQIEGNGQARQTAGQLASEANFEEAEVILEWQQGWLAILTYLEDNKGHSPIFMALYQELIENGGLCSQSVRETYRYLATGNTPSEIAEKRRLKASTIHDHLSEMAIIYTKFPFDRFLDEKMLTYIDEAIEASEIRDYLAIQAEFQNIPFFENRLMQIKNEVGLK